MNQPQPETAEGQLRIMLGDLLMQIAMLRAENLNLRSMLTPEQQEGLAKLNGAQQPAMRQ